MSSINPSPTNQSPVAHDRRNETAASPLTAPPLTSGPLDNALKTVRGGYGSVSARLNTIVPFPTALPSPADASITELILSFDAIGRVQATVEYSSAMPLDEVAELYRVELTDAGVALSDLISPSAHLAVVHGQPLEPTTGASAATAPTSTRISIDDRNGRRQVRLEVSYADYDTTALFSRFANWDQGAAPIDDAPIERFEVKTLEHRYSPTFATYYTTGYRLPGTRIEALRPLIERRLAHAGWTWLEPEPDVLFLSGAFDAELHLRHDSDDTLIDFVGEFNVALDRAAS